MDWTTIVLALLSGTTVGSVVELIRYRKQDKKLKDNTVVQSSIETQKAEIDLANIYKEEMLKVIDLLKQNQLENTDNQTEMKEMLTNLDRRMDRMETHIDDIETYLNGNYHAWLANKEKKQVSL